MPRHPNLTPRAKQIIRELKEVAEKKRSMSVRYHEHLMAELARLGLVRNEYALKGPPRKGTKSKQVPKKGQGEGQALKVIRVLKGALQEKWFPMERFLLKPLLGRQCTAINMGAKCRLKGALLQTRILVVLERCLSL